MSDPNPNPCAPLSTPTPTPTRAKPSHSSSLLVYRLSPSKSKDSLKRCVSTDPTSGHHSSSSQPKKRYLVSQKSGKVYEIVDKTRVSGRAVTASAASMREPESDLISDDEYFRYLDLIGAKRLTTDRKSALRQWSLRDVSKVRTSPSLDPNGHVLCPEVCPKPMLSEPEEEPNERPNGSKCDVSRRKLAKSQWLSEVRDRTSTEANTSATANEWNRKRERELRDWKTLTQNTISFFELSSAMGQRLHRTLDKTLNDLQKYLSVCNYEDNCATDEVVRDLPSHGLYGLNGVTRITRTRDGGEWASRHFQHNYCFTRSQRLEKWRELETGLNWRSRLMKARCKQLVVRVDRVVNCPICSRTVDSDPRHQCYEFEPHLRPNYSSFGRHSDDSEEVVIIGDDFMSEDLSPAESPANEMCCERLTATSDDDEVMIVEEVIKSTVRPKLVLNPVKQTARPSNGLPSKRPSIMSLSQKANQIQSLPQQKVFDTKDNCHRSDISSENSISKQNEFRFATNVCVLKEEYNS